MSESLCITQAQYESYQQVVLKWDEYQSLPDDFIVVANDDTRATTIGVWVGPQEKRTMYLGIELDGYMHS